MTPRAARRRRERGSVLAVVVVLAVLCGAFAASTVLTNAGRQQEERAVWASERAFAMAESGIDAGLARLRASHGSLLGLDEDAMAITGTGSFALTYGSGASNAADDDGDGETDELDEGEYQVLRSTGRSDGVERTVVCLLRSERRSPSFDAATVINVDAPVVDLSGRAFRMSGFEHGLDGTIDVTRPAKWSIATPADTSVVTSQIASRSFDQVEGAGGMPSVRTSPAIDLTALMESSRRAATRVLEPGTHANEALGTPTPAGVEVVRCDGDLHLSGTTGGAGVLVVEGDLVISGGFEWVGLILVHGRVRFVGGGSGKRLVGTLVVDEEVSNEGGSDMSVAGTVDLLFSTDAVELATAALIVPTIVAWRETGSP